MPIARWSGHAPPNSWREKMGVVGITVSSDIKTRKRRIKYRRSRAKALKQKQTAPPEWMRAAIAAISGLPALLAFHQPSDEEREWVAKGAKLLKEQK